MRRHTDRQTDGDRQIVTLNTTEGETERERERGKGERAERASLGHTPFFKVVTSLLEYSKTMWVGNQVLQGGSLSSGSFIMIAAKETAVRRTQGVKAKVKS